MMSRYPTAIEREAAKLAGDIDPPHPADRYDDPLAVRLAEMPAKANAKTPQLKHLGGSQSDEFNVGIVNAVLNASWIVNEADQKRLVTEAGFALTGINPQDELEGMIAAQMVAAHQASMECSRRAMLHEQTLEGRATNLAQASKAARTYAMLMDALDRHRHKGGEQRVVVEHVHRHVHVHDHPLTVDADPSGGGGQKKFEDQAHAPALEHQPAELAPMWSEDTEREQVPRTGDAEREVSNARRR